MKSQLSKNKDVDRLILSKVDDQQLLKICSIDKYTWNNVCDDDFLKRKLSKYTEIEKYKSKEESWKQFFLRAVNYIALMKEEFEYSYTFGDFKKQCVLLKKYKKDMNELLIRSAEVGELELVKWSLEKGAFIHSQHISALYCASRNGYLEVVRYLVEHGANIHAGDNKALRAANEKGHLEVVRYLVGHGADIHAENDYALRWASNNGYLEVVRYLVEHGANIHANDDAALRWASRYGHTEIVRYLVEHGENIHAINE